MLPCKKQVENRKCRNSGPAAGRPRGARSKITVAVETLIDAASTDIANKAIELARAGDPTMIRALLDR